ncbi:MAG: hypothetical protein AB7S36_12975, partial [Planctomycetota bacterium]
MTDDVDCDVYSRACGKPQRAGIIDGRPALASTGLRTTQALLHESRERKRVGPSERRDGEFSVGRQPFTRRCREEDEE